MDKVKRKRLSYRVIIAVAGGRCRKCGTRENLTINHKLPLNARGTNDPRNLEILCEKHHKELHGTNVRKKDLK